MDNKQTPISHKPIDDDDDYPDEYELLGEPEAHMEKGYRKVIVVDKLPKVNDEKFEKLVSVIKKVFSQFGTVLELYMPKDPSTEETYGFAFIEYPTEAAAEAAVKAVDNYRLDKQHILRVNSYEDFQKFDHLSETFTPVDIAPYKPPENLWWWLLDPQARDQYVVRYDDITEISWSNRHEKKPELVHKRREMTQTYVVWSPHGTYLGTFHKQGVILWGGQNWAKIKKLEHSGVRLMDFSPKETYVVTLSYEFQQNENPKDPKSILIWDTATGTIKRPFPIFKESQTAWPVFQWSHDEKYFARLAADSVYVYETPSMKIFGKPIPVPGIREFSWSPSDNFIACWTPESPNAPARISLIELPSGKIVRSHNLFQVIECKLHWQSKGEYLCAKVDRHGKKKTQVFTNFELYRVKEKDIPIDVLTITDKVLAFSWEPAGRRFAVIHVAQGLTAGAKTNVSFYSMDAKQHSKLTTLEKRSANLLFWSPAGRYIVLAGFGALGGALEFYDTQELDSMRVEQHPMVNGLEWDPTGRYVASIVSYWRHQSSLENGYTVWTFQGKEILHISREKFYQLLWRPRPPTLLTGEKLDAIKANLKEYSRKAKSLDSRKLKALWDERSKARDEKRSTFIKLREQRSAELGKDRENLRSRLGVRLPEDYEGEWEEHDEEVEEPLGDSVTEEVTEN